MKDCRFGIGRVKKDGFVGAAGPGPAAVVGIGTIGMQRCAGMEGWGWAGKIGILEAAGAGRMCWGVAVDVDGWVAAAGKTGMTGAVFERPASWTEAYVKEAVGMVGIGLESQRRNGDVEMSDWC